MADFQSSTRRCCNCSLSKPSVDFCRDRSTPDGLSRRCAECDKAKSAAYRAANVQRLVEARARSYAANADEQRARSRAYAKSHPDRKRVSNASYRAANLAELKAKYAVWAQANAAELKQRKADYDKRNTEKRKIASAAYRTANAIELRLKKAAYSKANRAVLRARNAAWRKANLDLAKMFSHLRRARKQAAKGTFTAAESRDIRRMQHDKCAACRIVLSGKGHLDHIVALARGGSNDRRNLQWLCAPCNQTKSARDPIEYMQSRGLLL